MGDSGLIYQGRPDLGPNRDRRFGITTLEKFPPYVYSILPNACLVHKVQRVDANWYKPRMESLERLLSPRLTIYTVCGSMFYAGRDKKRAEMCERPAENAVLCGRCHGEGPTLQRSDPSYNAKRREAMKKIGCASAVSTSRG